MRSKLYQYAEELNAKSLTPADYCVMCVGCDFDEPGNADHIHNEIKDVMEDRFGLGNKVQYVNAAYRINDFYEHMEDLHRLNGEIATVEHFIEEQKKETPDYNEDAYRADMGKKKLPKGFPKRKINKILVDKEGNPKLDDEGNPKRSFWKKKLPTNIDDARKELKETEEKIKELEEANLDERFLKVVFIVLDRPSDATRVLTE